MRGRTLSLCEIVNTRVLQQVLVLKKPISRVQILSRRTLYMSDVGLTSKFRALTMFCWHINDISYIFIGMLLVYLHVVFYIHKAKQPLIIDVNVKWKFEQDRHVVIL